VADEPIPSENAAESSPPASEDRKNNADLNGDRTGIGGAIPDVALRIGAAVLTGVGVVGLAALVGGLILTMRFEAARLPTEWAISVVPRTELITLGAEVLIPLTFALLLAFLLFRAAFVALPVDRHIRNHLWLQLLVGTLFVLPAVLVYYFLASHHIAFDGRLVLVVLIVLGGIAVCAVVGMPKPDDHRWGWFALTVLLVIAGVATGITWVRTYDTPQVRAAALVRSGDDDGIAGLFVAQTSDRVYLARVDHTGTAERGEGGSGRLISVPLDQVSELSVGQNQTLPKALSEAPKLLSELKLCQSPALDCEGDLVKLLPGFGRGDNTAPLAFADVQLRSQRQLTITLRNKATFALSVVKVMAVGMAQATKGHGRSVAFGPSRARIAIGVGKSAVVTLHPDSSGRALWTHPSHTNLRFTVELEAPNGSHTTISVRRHSVRRVDFA
jgi:hypothetical protein